MQFVQRHISIHKWLKSIYCNGSLSSRETEGDNRPGHNTGPFTVKNQIRPKFRRIEQVIVSKTQKNIYHYSGCPQPCGVGSTDFHLLTPAEEMGIFRYSSKIPTIMDMLLQDGKVLLTTTSLRSCFLG